MTATNHDDQLGEIFPMMLNELNCTFVVRFSSLWPSWSWFVAVMVYTPSVARVSILVGRGETI